MDTIRSPCFKKKIQQQHNIKYLMPKYSVWQILSCMRERPCLVQIGINDYHLLYLHIISCIILNKYLAANEKNTILRTLSSLKKKYYIFVYVSMCVYICNAHVCNFCKLYQNYFCPMKFLLKCFVNMLFKPYSHNF